MGDASLEPRRARVLSNVVVARSNPWVTSWLEASKAAGVDVVDLSTAAVLARGADAPSGAHLQWPERMLNPASPLAAARLVLRLLLLCALLRLRGRTVLLTAHNVRAHERRHPLLSTVLWWALDRLVTDVHVLSAAGRREVEQAHPLLARRTWHVIPHGDYLAQTAGAPSRTDARARLSLPADATVLTTVGGLRAYKGATDLVSTFRRWDRRDAVLLMAGRPAGPEEARDLRDAAGDDPRLHLTLEHIDDDELSGRVAAADLVVLPYRAVLNSGSAMYALSARRPVLVPSTPTFTELGEQVGPGWVRTYEGDLGVDDLLRASDEPPPARPPEMAWCSWSTITEQIAGLWGTR